MRKGFTLIEILIVVAIIAILASVVLIGLGPTQQSGRDARRLSDLHQAQNAIELYFNKCGFYPGTANCAATTNPANWAALSAAITGSSVGVPNALPNDPSVAGGTNYFYENFSGGATYTIGAKLENVNNPVFNGYNVPVNVPAGHACTAAGSEYCMSL